MTPPWVCADRFCPDNFVCDGCPCSAAFSRGILAKPKEEFKPNLFELYDETRIFHVSAMHRLQSVFLDQNDDDRKTCEPDILQLPDRK
jgi:hypothetical protein